MAFTPLTFTKSWENAEDFPTYEPDEAQVRADLQYLYDEIRDAFNGLVAALNDASAASNLPVSVEGLTAGTLQEALEETLAEVQKAAAGQIVNGSITKEKLHETLLRRVYGGRLVVSWDTPGAANNESTDCPVGQLWLRPALTVENRAGASWTCSGCTAEAQSGGWTFSADQTMAAASATQQISGLGLAGQTALVHLTLPGRDASLTALTVYVGGAAVTLPDDGWLETTLNSAGGLEIQISAQWPSAQAAGYFQVGDLTVAAVGALEAVFPQCTPPSDWKALLDGQLPFETFSRPRMVFLETADGVWEALDYEVLPVSRGGTGLAAVEAGQLLYGGSGGRFETLDPPDVDGALLRFSDGAPQWVSQAQTAADFGTVRLFQGSYTGNNAVRTISLAAAPRLLVIKGVNEDGFLLLQGQQIQRTVQCSSMDYNGYYPIYTVGIQVQNNQLSIWMNASQNALECGAAARQWNESGKVYHYVGLY